MRNNSKPLIQFAQDKNSAITIISQNPNTICIFPYKSTFFHTSPRYHIAFIKERNFKTKTRLSKIVATENHEMITTPDEIRANYTFSYTKAITRVQILAVKVTQKSGGVKVASANSNIKIRGSVNFNNPQELLAAVKTEITPQIPKFKQTTAPLHSSNTQANTGEITNTFNPSNTADANNSFKENQPNHLPS